MSEHTIEQVIKGWLQENPSGRLYVAVGYASSWGIRWLSEHAKNRPVTLIIGDPRRKWQRDSEVDRRVVIQFLERHDVEVKSWYSKKHRSQAHFKAWVARRPDGGANILFGSANLTRAGLRNNREMMGEPSQRYKSLLLQRMEDLLLVAWPDTKLHSWLVSLEQSSQRDQSSASKPSQPHKQSSAPRSRQPYGQPPARRPGRRHEQPSASRPSQQHGQPPASRPSQQHGQPPAVRPSQPYGQSPTPRPSPSHGQSSAPRPSQPYGQPVPLSRPTPHHAYQPVGTDTPKKAPKGRWLTRALTVAAFAAVVITALVVVYMVWL